MAFSKITIVFNRRVEVGENVQFEWRDLDISGGINSFLTNEVCADPRTRPGQFSYELTGNQGDLSALRYQQAFIYDYNGGNNFTVTYNGGNSVIIEAKKTNIEFFGELTNAGVTFTIENEPQVPTFFIDSVVNLEAATDKCTNVKVRVECSDIIQDLLLPVQILGVNATFVEFDYVRGTNFLVRVDNGIETRDQSHTTPFFLAEPTVTVVNSPTGATATASIQNTLSGLTYSLNNIDYQSSRSFPGLADGNYTMYVKDTFGCVKSTGFSVSEFTPVVGVTDPFAYISNSNSIRFKKDELWDNNTIFKNDGNTLSYEERGELLLPFIHKFTDQDVVTTQIKTNFETVDIKVINCTNDTEDFPVAIQKTANLDKVDKRDAIGYVFDSGFYGIYFQTGNLYEDNAPVNTVKGTYQLFGNLPEWGKIGNYVQVNDGAYAKITDIQFVESLNSQVLVLDTSFAPETSLIVRCQYNVFNWDAYEFDIDMSSYLNKEIQVVVELTDSNFDSVTFISEKIQVYADLSHQMTIQAKSSENNDVVYQTGIEHIVRADIDLDGLADESELEIHKADDNVYQLDGYSYAKRTVVFTRVSTMIARQLRRILTLDDIKINGVRCAIESVDSPERIGISNMYRLSATYYEVVERPTTSDVSTDVDLDILDIPALVQGNGSFIKQ